MRRSQPRSRATARKRVNGVVLSAALESSSWGHLGACGSNQRLQRGVVALQQDDHVREGLGARDQQRAQHARRLACAAAQLVRERRLLGPRQQRLRRLLAAHLRQGRQSGMAPKLKGSRVNKPQTHSAEGPASSAGCSAHAGSAGAGSTRRTCGRGRSPAVGSPSERPPRGTSCMSQGIPWPAPRLRCARLSVNG